MKQISTLRWSVSFLVIFAMLTPMSVLAMGDGKKHFSEGIKQETAEQWDKAAEEFALAVSDNPKSPEYKLHLVRALFMASQMYMKKGAAAASEKDYAGGYNAYRRAYAYDPTNELAKSEMERMVRMQQGITAPTGDTDTVGGSNTDLRLVQTGYKKPAVVIPQKLETLRDVPFPGGVDLQYIIKDMAKDLELNVLFDSQSPAFRGARSVKIDLRNVSAAQALDYIFLQEGLFFQKVGPRTILVSDSSRRPIFQQLVLRTFYLQNADPAKIKPLVQAAIPAQPGRSQTIVMDDAATNSITIRDTEENIKLIGRLIQSLDKDRAEVVMDVAIYEVNKSDLMQFGNQLGTAGDNGSLLNLGGVGLPVIHRGTTQAITQNLPAAILGSASMAFGLPLSNIVALQSKNNTKLLASTQIHAFNNEDSSATIGQRVPVQTAQFVTGTNTTASGGIVSNVINYEQVGLTLKFKPLVFPNQDVQVAMEITSKDVAGASTLTPVFTERTIKGTARVQNNKTLLLASVAQDVETKGRQGLPLIGLIPILGRLFTAPTRDNRQVDIVIAITPKVIRAPSILPDDEIERPTGSQATPTNSSLVAMIMQDEMDDQVAAARRTPTNTAVQLPDQPADSPAYVRTAATAQADAQQNNTTAAVTPQTTTPPIDASILKPIDTSAVTLNIKKTSDTSLQQQPISEQPRATLQPTEDPVPAATANAPRATIRFANDLPVMKVGDKVKVPVMIDGSMAFRSATLGLIFDDKKVAVRSVAFGDLFGSKVANTTATPFLNQNGKMYVTLSPAEAAMQGSTGTIAYIEIEALTEGKPDISFDRQTMTVLTPEGKNFSILF
jgi:general secretion pathway protein D